MGGPGRRNWSRYLAERALLPVLPTEEIYAIRSVTEGYEPERSDFNGGDLIVACLALMDAGVPISAPASGIAMGLMWMGTAIFVCVERYR